METGRDGRELGYDKKERFRRNKRKAVKESKEKRPHKGNLEGEETREIRIKFILFGVSLQYACKI
jgi:hypothetical protein